jgi:hypothetical protein
MHTVTSFHASAVQSDALNAIMADFVAVEHARVIRRLLLTRFGFLALIAGLLGATFHHLTSFAWSFSIGAFLAPPTWAWLIELRRSRQLARRLAGIPQGVTHVLPVHAVTDLDTHLRTKS